MEWFTSSSLNFVVTNGKRPGKRIEVSTEGIVNKINYIVSADRGTKTHDVVDAEDISTVFCRKFWAWKVFCKLDAAFRDSSPKTKSRNNFRAMVALQPKLIFSSVRNVDETWSTITCQKQSNNQSNGLLPRTVLKRR